MKLNIEDKNKSGIYCIYNKINNKVYIGKSKNIYFRIKQHITHLNTKNKNENLHFINSWSKYGKENFDYKVLEYTNIDLLKERELYWIKQYNSINRNFGYNFRLDSETGLIISKETRLKLSKAQKKRCENKEHIQFLTNNFVTYRKNNPNWKESMKDNLSKSRSKYKIIQYTLQDNFIKEWNTMRELLLKNPKFKRHNIYAVCSGEKPSMYGYKWKKELKI